MPRDPDPVTVALPTGAALLRRLDAVAADLHLDRPGALHAALLSWLEQGRAQNRRPEPYAHDTGVDEARSAY